MHKSLERPQIAGERAALQGIEIRLADLGTNRDRRIAGADEQEVHQQTRGAPIAVAERVDGGESEMRLERAFGR